MLLFAASLFLLPVITTASNVNIYHRVFVPGQPENSFVQRGVIDSLESHFQPSSSLSRQWRDFEASLDGASSNLEHVLYQVALQRQNSEWDISSVKLCHIPFIASESIILHSSHASQPEFPLYALDYFVSPVPDDGSCPRLGAGSARLASPFHSMTQLNTTVVNSIDTLPVPPQLRAPPPLTAEGAPVQPVPEKSFIQKYWMYIAAALLVLMMTGGSAEEGQVKAE